MPHYSCIMREMFHIHCHIKTRFLYGLLLIEISFFLELYVRKKI